MELCRIISETQSDIGWKQKTQTFGTPISILCPRWRWHYRNFTVEFPVEKLEWWKSEMVSLALLDTIHECDGRTDRRTPHVSKDRTMHTVMWYDPSQISKVDKYRKCCNGLVLYPFTVHLFEHVCRTPNDRLVKNVLPGYKNGVGRRGRQPKGWKLKIGSSGGNS